MKRHTGGEKASSICNNVERMYEKHFKDLITKSREKGLEHGVVWCMKETAEKGDGASSPMYEVVSEGSNVYQIKNIESPGPGSKSSIALPDPKCKRNEVRGKFHTHPGQDIDNLYYSFKDKWNNLILGIGVSCIAAEQDGRRRIICDTLNTDHEDYSKNRREANKLEWYKYDAEAFEYMNMMEDNSTKYSDLVAKYDGLMEYDKKMNMVIANAINDGVVQRCSKESNLAPNS